MNIKTNLFDFAFVPAWFEQLITLSEMVLSEPWGFKSPIKNSTNEATPILERYIKTIFHKQALAYIFAENGIDADRAFYIRNEFACLHTGLFTRRYDGIYMCFERNKRKDSMLEWFFKGWADNSSPLLRYISPLPERPMYSSESSQKTFQPDWPIRVNVDHILGDEENIQRLPESVRHMWNLPLLLETAVELGRRRAVVYPSKEDNKRLLSLTIENHVSLLTMAGGLIKSIEINYGRRLHHVFCNTTIGSKALEYLSEFFSNTRNGYFHKHNLYTKDQIKAIRKEAYCAYFLLGAAFVFSVDILEGIEA